MEKLDEEVEEGRGAGDGELEDEEEFKEDVEGGDEEGWTEENFGGVETGEGEGRAEREGDVLGWFFMKEEEERKEVFDGARVELPV